MAKTNSNLKRQTSEAATHCLGGAASADAGADAGGGGVQHVYFAIARSCLRSE